MGRMSDNGGYRRRHAEYIAAQPRSRLRGTVILITEIEGRESE